MISNNAVFGRAEGHGISASQGTSVTPGAEASYLLDTAHGTKFALGARIIAESGLGTEGLSGFSQRALGDAVLWSA